MARIANGQYVLSATEAVEIATMINAGAAKHGPIITSDSGLRNWDEQATNIMFAFAPDGNIVAWWTRYADGSYIGRVGAEPLIFCWRREQHKLEPITTAISRTRKVKIYYLQRINNVYVLQA